MSIRMSIDRSMSAASRTLSRCLVCGFAEVRTDEVVDRGIVLLAECPRCEYRCTWRPSVLELAPARWPERPALARAVAGGSRDAQAEPSVRAA